MAGAFNLYLSVLKKYAVFGGRARRREYWTFAFVNALLQWVPLCLLSAAYFAPLSFYGWLYEVLRIDLRPQGYVVIAGGSALALYMLATVLPGIAVTVRRLHDTNHGGSWVFISLLPVVGSIVLLLFLTTDSTGDNQFGPDPKTAYAGVPTIPAGWLDDPTGRHEKRYWDSHAWTNQVADAGVASVDAVQM